MCCRIPMAYYGLFVPPATLTKSLHVNVSIQVWDLLEACFFFSPPILISSRISYQEKFGGWRFEIGTDIIYPYPPAIKHSTGESLIHMGSFWWENHRWFAMNSRQGHSFSRSFPSIFHSSGSMQEDVTHHGSRADWAAHGAAVRAALACARISLMVTFWVISESLW